MNNTRYVVILGTILLASIVARPLLGGSANFIRGDVNDDGSFDIGDAIAGLDYLFGSTTLECVDALDANDDGGADIADAISILATLFSGGADPAAPFPSCGSDPTPDGLTCDAFATCCGGPDAYEPNETIAQCSWLGVITDSAPFPAGTVNPGFETLTEEDWFCFHIDDDIGGIVNPLVSIPNIPPGAEIELWVTWFCTITGQSGFEAITSGGASSMQLSPVFICGGVLDSMDISFCVRQVGGPITCETLLVEWGDN